MALVIPCPIPGFDGRNDDGTPIYYVTIPDPWLVEHSVKRDKAIARVEGKGYGNDVLTFSVSLELADDFNLPDLTGKVTDDNEAEKMLRMRLDVMAWVNTVVYGSYNDCFDVKKKYLSWLSSLLRAASQAMTTLDGG